VDCSVVPCPCSLQRFVDMSEVAELKALVKQLQSAPKSEAIIDVLTALKKQAKINEAILRESKAGLAVGKLRSHGDKQVSELAKEIVKKWKTDVEAHKRTNGSHSANGKANPGRKNSSSSAAASKSASGSPAIPSPPVIKAELRTAKGDGISTVWTGDKTRDKCVELFYDALASDSGAPNDLIVSRATAVEKAVWNNQGGTTATYKAKVRSLFVNLKDKNNPGLRESVVSGDLSAERFSKMTSEEMASEERKAANSKIKEENLFASFGAAEREAETDAFQCGRCKQRKCRYRQAQTRSADEPMTTFVTCTVCNNRWKFS